jgi:hypothetical protein
MQQENATQQQTKAHPDIQNLHNKHWGQKPLAISTFVVFF